ncbi:MAG TPA: EamA family transporter [Kiritimatiellia bacterium]|nr:EamA family transporter [Kiritimatiellia bacterium]
MFLLTAVSLLWAFSFGLIGNRLGDLPPGWLAWVRLALSAAVFLPFVCRIPWRCAISLFITGAVQFGLMYWAYMSSFHWLQSHEVALFTVLTPLFVAVLNDATQRRFHLRNLIAALLAVAGAAWIRWTQLESAAPLWGILLVQISNLCFAAGQLAYRAILARLPRPLPDLNVFFWLHFGGMAVLTPLALPLTLGDHPPAPTPEQWGVLIYLGLIASGVGFFLWNRGARQVSAGALAIMNNLKIPLSVAVSLLFFRETAQWPTLLVGTALILFAFYPLRRRQAK